MNKEKFIGTWKLKSFAARLSDGSIVYPNGKNLIGYIMYSEDGYVSVLIMEKDREKFNEKFSPSREFWKTVANQKKSAAFETFFSYCGHYEIKNDEIIIHRLEACSIPDWVGTSQERIYKFSANTLTLSQITQHATATLVWEHV